jgi:hypothetical protein
MRPRGPWRSLMACINLPETLVFTPADSGSEKFLIIYQADNEGKAVLSGGLKLDLKWESHGDGILKAATSAGLSIDQLFIDGKRQRMARYPNYDANQPTAAWLWMSPFECSRAGSD